MLKAEAWTTVVTTRDIILIAEEREVGFVADMEFARKAAVFVGNGVSALVFFSFDFKFADTPTYSGHRSQVASYIGEGWINGSTIPIVSSNDGISYIHGY